MPDSAHVIELKKKHANLSKEIELTQRRPASDSAELSAMKREKLRLKETIERLAQAD